MKAQILEKLNDLKTRSGKSYEDVHDALGYATSTIHRWHKGESEPDLDQLTSLVEYYGGSMEKLFAAVGKQELAATQNLGYQGADAMVTHYEARLGAKDEKYALLQEHHAARLDDLQRSHERSVAYLKEEISRLRGELELANRTALNLTSKKYTVFWALIGIIAMLSVLLFIALRTGPIF